MINMTDGRWGSLTRKSMKGTHKVSITKGKKLKNTNNDGIIVNIIV